MKKLARIMNLTLAYWKKCWQIGWECGRYGLNETYKSSMAYERQNYLREMKSLIN
jgi:hypothetical protein